MSDRPANVVALTQQGRPTDQETKDECFRLWVELGRSWKAVSDRTGIAVRTLHYWGEAGDWERRRSDLAAAFLPGKKTETAIALRLSAHNAAIRLQQLSNDALELGTPIDYRQVDALTKIIAAGGYSSVGNRNPLEGLDKLASASTDIDFDAMTVEELREYEQQVKRKKRFESPAPAVNGSRGKT